MQPLPIRPEALVELAFSALEGAVGGWSMGVEGAVAEFAVPGGAPAAVAVSRFGRAVEARTPGGGLRLWVNEETRAFTGAGREAADGVGTVWLAVPRQLLPEPPPGLTVAEGDPGALRPRDRDGLLVDLAVGHGPAAFCVRTDDPELGRRLRSLEGAPWRATLEEIGHALVAASPDRVVTSPLGRIEVYGPIPPAGGESPDGPHTHLLPALLATGRELPPGVTLPADLAPAVAFHPPPGWMPPPG